MDGELYKSYCHYTFVLQLQSNYKYSDGSKELQNLVLTTLDLWNVDSVGLLITNTDHCC